MNGEVIGPGRVAVVTGGGSGIGRALCECLARRGMSVVVADVEARAGEEVATAIRTGGGDAVFARVDVADFESVRALADSTMGRYGQVDLLCNNAGVSTFNLMREQTLEDWRWVIDVDLWGVIHGLHAFVPLMRARGTRAHVVNTSSMGGLMGGVPFIAPYVAAKAGVIAISETLARELEIEGTTNIGVSVLCPGSTDTKVMESERNRPASMGAERRSEVAESMRLMIKASFTSEFGKPPAEIAEIVCEAVRTNRFWILTHPYERPTIESRARSILESFPR